MCSLNFSFPAVLSSSPGSRVLHECQILDAEPNSSTQYFVQEGQARSPPAAPESASGLLARGAHSSNAFLSSLSLQVYPVSALEHEQ